jgi:hypothetical protein
MAKPDFTITDRQFKVYEGLQKIKMAWVALWAVLILFSVVLIAFLCALFFVRSESIAKTALGATDATLGWALRTVYAYLFPPPSKTAE